jgi:hypothetical protein
MSPDPHVCPQVVHVASDRAGRAEGRAAGVTRPLTAVASLLRSHRVGAAAKRHEAIVTGEGGAGQLQNCGGVVAGQRQWGTSARSARYKPGDGTRKELSTGLARLTHFDTTAYRVEVEPVSTGAPCPHDARGRRCCPWSATASSSSTHAQHRAPAAAHPDHAPLATPTEIRREQAHVPAEQPPPSQGARLPPADAHPRGPVDPVRASAQGSRQARGLSAPPVCVGARGA